MPKKRSAQIDSVQSEQYKFPYHYLPSPVGFPNFTKTWDFAPSYIASILMFTEWLDLQAEKVQSLKHIDFGCGDGGFIFNTQRLVAGDVRFTGIDTDFKAVSWAKQFSSVNNYIAGDISELDSGAYDSGSLIEVYEHIPPEEGPLFISELARALKPGARIYVTVPSVEIPVTEKHYRHFTFETLAEEFGAHFEVESVFGFERNVGLIRLLRKITSNRFWFVESRWTNKIMIDGLRRQYKTLDGCARIGLIAKKKDTITD